MKILKHSLNIMSCDKKYAENSRSEHRSTTYCSCSCNK